MEDSRARSIRRTRATISFIKQVCAACVLESGIYLTWIKLPARVRVQEGSEIHSINVEFACADLKNNKAKLETEMLNDEDETHAMTALCIRSVYVIGCIGSKQNIPYQQGKMQVDNPIFNNPIPLSVFTLTAEQAWDCFRAKELGDFPSPGFSASIAIHRWRC